MHPLQNACDSLDDCGNFCNSHCGICNGCHVSTKETTQQQWQPQLPTPLLWLVEPLRRWIRTVITKFIMVIPVAGLLFPTAVQRTVQWRCMTAIPVAESGLQVSFVKNRQILLSALTGKQNFQKSWNQKPGKEMQKYLNPNFTNDLVQATINFQCCQWSAAEFDWVSVQCACSSIKFWWPSMKVQPWNRCWQFVFSITLVLTEKIFFIGADKEFFQLYMGAVNKFSQYNLF